MAGVLAGLMACGFGPVHVLAGALPVKAARPPSPSIDLARCCGPFSCESYLEVAAALQALPEEQRVAQLRAWADAKDFGQPALAEPVVALCRMLFEPKPGMPFWPSSLATTNFLGRWDGSSQDYGLAQAWPLGPITLVNDIPFSVVEEFHFDGPFDDISFPKGGSDFGMYEITPPDAGLYLDYCLKDTRWTSHRYAPATKETLQQALDQLRKQHLWPDRLNERQGNFLADQIRPAKPLPLWITGAGASTEKRGSGQRYDRAESSDDRPKFFSVGDEGRVSFKLEWSVNGGIRPYHYSITGKGVGEPRSTPVAQGKGQEAVFNPYTKEKFAVRCSQPAGGDRLVFKLVNNEGEQAIVTGDLLLFTVEVATGAKLTQRLQVIGPGAIVIFRPATPPLAVASKVTRPVVPSS